MQLFADYHVHTNYSDDSVYPMADVVRDAVALGLEEICYDLQGPFPFEKIHPLAAEILTTVIADGKGIEVNTSCFRYGLPDLTPSAQILKLYRDLGGEIITLGSDSHKKEHLGQHIRKAAGMLKELGFTSFCTFDKMKPIFHAL